MARSAEPFVVSAVEREELDRLVRGHSTPQQLALRARIILLAAEGIGNRDSARRLGGYGSDSPVLAAALGRRARSDAG